MYQQYFAETPPVLEDAGEHIVIKPVGATHTVAVSEQTLYLFVLRATELLAKRRLAALGGNVVRLRG